MIVRFDLPVADCLIHFYDIFTKLLIRNPADYNEDHCD